MTDDNSLYSDPKQPDEFRTESPLRAFAEYTEHQGWMIAKGFRPSMQHLVRYLAAMERREGYRLVQILEAPTGVPTMIFRTTARAPLDVVSDVFKASEIERGNEQSLMRKRKPTFTFSGPVDTSAYSPEIADYETDDEGKPWKLHVVFMGERATFFADFFRGDRREPTDHSSHYVVEWFDNVTQTVHRQPVAEWPEWAQELLNAKPYAEDSASAIPSKSFAFTGSRESVERWLESCEEEMARVMIGNNVKVEDLKPKGWRFVCMKGGYAYFKRDIPAIPDWTPPEGATYGFWADGRLFIDFGRQCLGDAARLAAPPGYAFYGFKEGDQRIAFYTEVTSQSPVDVLETMAEDIADELGIEVDRDSFQVAREHLKQTVGAYDIPDDQKEEAAEFVIGKFKSGKLAAVVLRDFKKSFMNPKGTPVSHTRLDEQLQFILGGGIDIWLIRNYLASFKMTKQPMKFDDANPAHYNGWECGDIGERLSANGYQILKYCWRLGKKDDPCKELGKAIRYCEREIDLMIAEGAKSHNPEMRVMPDLTGIARGGSPDHIKADEEFFLHNRIAKEPDFTKTIAIKLWSGYNLSQLEAIKADIADHKATLDCGHGLAI